MGSGIEFKKRSSTSATVNTSPGKSSSYGRLITRRDSTITTYLDGAVNSPIQRANNSITLTLDTLGTKHGGAAHPPSVQLVH